MKRITLMVSAICIALVSFSQEVSYAPVLGLNLTNIGGDTDVMNDENSMKIGYKIGGVADVNFGAFGIQPGLLLSNKGFTVKDGDDKITFSTNYLEIPVNLYYGLDLGGNQLQIIAGPYVGLGLFGKVKYDIDGTTEKTKIKFKNDFSADDLAGDEEGIARTDFGLNFGVGYKMGPIQVQAIYGLGLSNLNPKYEGEKPDTKLTNTNIQISAAYFFGK